jgi:hypothetical protein
MDLGTRDSNPYAPPRAALGAPPASRTASSPLRRRAVRWLRLSLLILLPAALANWAVLSPPHRFAVLSISVVIHDFLLLLMLAGFLVLLFAGMPVLEWTAERIRRWVAPRVSARRWRNTLYAGLWPTIWAATLGLILWLAWVYLFFLNRQLNRLVLCQVMGTIGHLLGAWVYGSVLVGWFRLWRRAA